MSKLYRSNIAPDCSLERITVGAGIYAQRRCTVNVERGVEEKHVGPLTDPQAQDQI